VPSNTNYIFLLSLSFVQNKQTMRGERQFAGRTITVSEDVAKVIHTSYVLHQLTVTAQEAQCTGVYRLPVRVSRRVSTYHLFRASAILEFQRLATVSWSGVGGWYHYGTLNLLQHDSQDESDGASPASDPYTTDDEFDEMLV